MTNAEKLDWLYRLKSEIYVYMPKEWLIPMGNALDDAIKALSKPAIPLNDLISREETLELFPLILSGELISIETVREQLRKLPAIEGVPISVLKDKIKKGIHKEIKSGGKWSGGWYEVTQEYAIKKFDAIIDKAVKEIEHECS